MRKYRLLLIGDAPKVAEHLQNIFDVTAMPNVEDGVKALRSQHWHLVMVRIAEADFFPNSALQNLLNDDDIVTPKVILCTAVLENYINSMMTALASRGAHPKAEALIYADDLSQIEDAARRILKQRLGDSNKLIDDSAATLQSIIECIAPKAGADEQERLVAELEELLQMLFRDCTKITVMTRDDERRSPIPTVWVTPSSKIILHGHPVRVRCGWRKDVEKLKDKCEKYWFRATSTRLEGYVYGGKLAVLAIPATERESFTINRSRESERKYFPEFFQETASNRSEPEAVQPVLAVIDDLFKNEIHWLRSSPCKTQQSLMELYEPHLCEYGKYPDILDDAINRIAKRADNVGVFVIRDEADHRITFGLSTDKDDQKQFIDPFWALTKDDSIQKHLQLTQFRQGLVHWRIHKRNFSVITNLRRALLDEYEHVDVGPLLSYVAQVEGLVKFHCIPDEVMALRCLYDLEKSLLMPARVGENKSQIARGLTLYEVENSLYPIAHTIVELREKWMRPLDNPYSMAHYYTNLLLLTVREFVAPENAREDTNLLVNLYRLLSAAMICQRLLMIDQPTPTQGGTKLHQTVLTDEVRRELIDTILRVPSAGTHGGRSGFLEGIVGGDRLCRNESIAYDDIDNVLKQLDKLGRQVSGHWPLVIFLDNVFHAVEAFEVAQIIRQHRDNLQRLYSAAEADVR